MRDMFNGESRVVKLSEMAPGETGDLFALLAGKDKGTTRTGKPYYRLTFRDAGRTVAAMVWNDSALFDSCDSLWKKGGFFKIRGRYSESNYGPQLELEEMRPVIDEDAGDGFNPHEFYLGTRFDAAGMFRTLVSLAEQQIADSALRRLVVSLLKEHEATLLILPAASRHHHAFAGGFLEHVLSVTKTAIYLADKYIEYYPRLELSKDLVVAGAILHDIGKLLELDPRPEGASYTPVGRLVGHILLGRDMVREKARSIDDLDAEILLRLEHLIIAHQALPEWGSPIPPSTPEALLVHYSDDIDAKFNMMATALEAPPAGDDCFTGRDNPLRRQLFRGLGDGRKS